MIDIRTWARSVLLTTPKRWQDLVATLPAELLTLPPSPGE